MRLEVWLPIPGFPDYAVSDHGRVKRITDGRSTYAGKILKDGWQGRGYRIVSLSNRETGRTRLVHQLVMLAFVGPPPADMEINHKDGDKTNNRLTNLEYCTTAYNHAHAARTGLKARGEGHGESKLTERQVLDIRARVANGEHHNALAKEYGLAPRTVGEIIQRKWWKHI